MKEQGGNNTKSKCSPQGIEDGELQSVMGKGGIIGEIIDPIHGKPGQCTHQECIPPCPKLSNPRRTMVVQRNNESEKNPGKRRAPDTERHFTLDVIVHGFVQRFPYHG